MMSSENSLPLATLKTIYLQELRRGSTGEKEKLFAAAQDNGIFYLDFTEDLGEHRISDLIQNIYSLSQSLFDLDLDEKMQYDVDQISKLKLNGCVSDCRFIVSCLALLTFYSYKPISRNIGGIEGQRDGFESYAVCNTFNLPQSHGNISELIRYRSHATESSVLTPSSTPHSWTTTSTSSKTSS
jgi:isopenicillin N synthase-like dioxygenase